ncbi:hypothetical protein [Kitasatospora sp. NPDC090308]
MYHNQLAQTGAGVLVIGGLTLAGWWMAAAAAALIAGGVLCVRIGFRREQ